MRYIFLIIYSLAFTCSFSQTKKTVKPTRILFVFDASNSMKAMHQGITRMEGAKNLFYKFMIFYPKQFYF